MNASPNPARGRHGMATAPNALAAQSAMAVLREGGNAVEAMIAAAATIAVVYPHMNSIGGDGFWLIRPGEAPRGIEACGAAGSRGHASTVYRERGLSSRFRFAAAWRPNGRRHDVRLGCGPRLRARALGGRLPLARLLQDAIDYARARHPGDAQPGATARPASATSLPASPGFARHVPARRRRAAQPAALFLQPRLAATLRAAGPAGLDDFYRGDLARSRWRRAGARWAARSRWTTCAAIARSWRTPLALEHSLGTRLQHAAADAGRWCR